MGVKSYRELIVWQKSMDLSVLLYKLTDNFPAEEKFGLTSQLRRSVTSIAANIAEGFGRESTRSFVQFLRISQGSLRETETHLILANRLGFVTNENSNQMLLKCDEIGKMLRSLIAKTGKSGS